MLRTSRHTTKALQFYSRKNLLAKSSKIRTIATTINPTAIIDDDITKAVPLIDEMIKSLSPEIRSCLPLLSIGAMSHGSIGYLPHVHISAGANLTALFAYRYSLKDEEQAEFDALLKEKGVQAGLQFLWSKKEESYPGPTSNSGEGGELPVRDGSLYQSYTRQVASGRFGVDLRYLGNACELQIKVAQGAKPGVGGQLPGKKVTDEIAHSRFAITGLPLLSPPPHHDIYSIEDLRQLIHDLRSVNPDAKISVKIAANYGCAPVAVGIAKCFTPKKYGDKIGIIIAGPGGTGAATITDKHEINHPWELALSETHQLLVLEGLRERTVLTASGGIQTGTDVFKALLLGADRSEIGSGILVSLGCVMVSQCHTGKCPAGIATTDWQHIQEKYKGKPEHVARMLIDVATAVSKRLDQYGFDSPSEAVGRVDLLKVKEKSPLVGLERLLTRTQSPSWVSPTMKWDDHTSHIEEEVLQRINSGEKDITVDASSRILSFGAGIGYESLKNNSLLGVDPVNVTFKGLSVGQSFGFAAPEGLNLVAENANDGVGKLLSGANIFVSGLTGSCVGYGASKGLIAASICGDRLAVRANHEVRIIAGTVGNSACNFMTGGRVTILYEAGPNLGAGFTGGVIYMPRELYNKLQDRNYLAESIMGMEPQELTEEDVAALSEDLVSYNARVEKVDIDISSFIKITPPPAVTGEHDPDALQLVPFWNEKNAGRYFAPPMPDELPPRDKDSCGVGLLVSRKGVASKDLVEKSLKMVASFAHRGSVSADPLTGDGCGITFYGVHSFFNNKFPHLKLEEGNYGIVVLKTDDQKSSQVMKKLLAQENLEIVGKRKVITNPSVLGPIGIQYEGPIKQYIVLPKVQVERHELEKSLVRMRLRFEYAMQTNLSKTRPHIFSASTYHVIYKTLALEKDFDTYYVDTKDPHFEASAAISHVRFATNTLPQMKNIQPLPGLVNNGENNNIGQIERLLTEDPGLRDLLGVAPDLTSLSDSHVQSMFVDYAFLERFGANAPSIESVWGVASAVNPPYVPKGKPKREMSEYFDVMGEPWEGPLGGILCFGNVVTVMRDRNGFRPLRGVENDDYMYVGSELGPVEIEGTAFNVAPAQPMVVDTVSGAYLRESPHKDLNKGRMGLETLSDLIKSDNSSFEYPTWTEEEFELQKRRAGWSKEVDTMIVQRLLRGEELTSSMGDQGPVEALVPGSNIDIGAFFKAKFAQVTNPALAKREESCFMSTDTWIGTRSEFGHWDEAEAVIENGILLSSPIIDAKELAAIESSPKIRVHRVSILYSVDEYDKGLKNAIDRVVKESITKVASYHANVLILTDLVQPDDTAQPNQTAIHPLLIVSQVDRALREAGVRRKASIVVQASPILIGRDVAQLISIGGADVIHPYMVLMQVVNDERATNNYKERLRQEIIGFMARMGISRVSAYRGAKIFSAYGLDKELAGMFGVESRVGGVSFSDLAKIQYNNYHVPSSEGLGRYQGESNERDKSWKPEVTQRLIKASRRTEPTQDFQEYETWADQTKHGVPRGWLDVVKPTRWTQETPMPMVIVGGGAAGFFLARHLLDSQLPITVTIIDRNYVNKCGLVGYGVAPDHSATKNQGYSLLKSVLEDDRVEYFGGIEVGKSLSISDLRKEYACIADCRGATKNISLGIPGDEHTSVLPASKIYEAYNSALVFNSHAQDWPFSETSRHPAVAIIGMGNVASDIARILLTPVDKFEDTKINPAFTLQLKRQGPCIVYIIARGDPTQCKITKKELEELKNLPDVSFNVSFEPTSETNLDENQQYLLDLFTELKERGPDTSCRKQLHFVFQSTPERIEDVDGDVEIFFEGKTAGIRVRNVVTALGRVPQASSEQIDYVAGWAARRGGNLKVAEQSAQQIASKIVQDYTRHMFHATQEDHRNAKWKFLSSVNKYEFMSIFEYSEKKVILNASDFHLAKSSNISIGKEEEEVDVELPSDVVSKPDVITVSDGQRQWDFIPGDGTFLQDLKLMAEQDPSYKDAVPKYECDGEGTCGTCGLLSNSADSLQSSKERRLLAIDGAAMKKCGVLTCQHNSKDLKGEIFFLPQILKQKEA